MSAVSAPIPGVKVSTRSRRDQILLVAIVTLVVFGAFYLLAWKPQSAALTRAHDERASVQAQRAAVSATAAVEGTDEAVAAAAAVAAQMLVAVPAQIATAEVLRQFDGLATQTNVKLGDITLSQPVPLGANSSVMAPVDPAGGTTSSGPVSLGVTLSVSGDAASTSAFVAGLATMPRLVVVDQVTVQVTPADPVAGTAARQDVQVSARVFATGT